MDHQASVSQSDWGNLLRIFRAKRWGLPLGLCLLAACGADQSTPVGPAVSDSAGVRIFEHPPTALRRAQLELTELLRLGALDDSSAELFSEIVDGQILADGSIVIADRDSREVRQFSSTGKLIRTQGGKGQGPGEYDYILAIGSCSQEGFTVFDIGWQPSRYDVNGEFVEEHRLRLEDGRTPYKLACAVDGRMAVTNRAPREGPTPIGFHVAMARLRILAEDGSVEQDLGERIGSERFGRPTGSGPHPVGRSTDFAFDGSDLLVADGSFFGYERWRRAGTLAEIVRIDTPPPDLDSLMLEYRETTLARADGPGQRNRWRDEIDAMGVPKHATHISALRAFGPWILLRETAVGPEARWFAFADDTEAVGFLPLPAGTTVLDMTADRILTSQRTALDVPVAVLYQIRDAGALLDEFTAARVGAQQALAADAGYICRC